MRDRAARVRRLELATRSVKRAVHGGDAECVDCGKLRELGWDDRCQDCGDAWERQPRYEMRWYSGDPIVWSAPEVWTLAQAKREGLDLARLAIGEEIPLYDCDGSARRVS